MKIDFTSVKNIQFQYLEHLVLDGKEVVKREKLLKDIGRLRNVKQGPDGFIYVAVEGKGIVRLIEAKTPGSKEGN